MGLPKYLVYEIFIRFVWVHITIKTFRRMTNAFRIEIRHFFVFKFKKRNDL